MRLTGFAVLVLLSLGVAGYAVVVYGFLPLGVLVHPDIRAAYEAHRLGIHLHVFAAAVALACGPFQFSSKLRVSRPALHRWTGRVYLAVGVLVGGLAGLYMSMHAYGGVVSRLGFACLALGWLYTGLRAYLAIRARDIASHRRWMVRNFSLAFGAVTLRLWLPAAVVSGVAFEVAYPVIAWLCWVPNLLVAEWTFNRALAGPVAAFWKKYVDGLAPGHAHRKAVPDAFSFGDNVELANELAALVKAGRKRATASLPVEFTSLGLPLPRVGDVGIVTLADGTPVAVIELVEVRHVPFAAVDASFAADEGEGIGTLAWWQAAHREYFGRVSARHGSRFDESTLVICQRFRVVDS